MRWIVFNISWLACCFFTGCPIYVIMPMVLTANLLDIKSLIYLTVDCEQEVEFVVFDHFVLHDLIRQDETSAVHNHLQQRTSQVAG